MSSKRFGKKEVVTVDFDTISFSLFTKKELKEICSTKIITPITLDAMGHPVPGGLYDPRMGPMADKSEPCGTCRKNVFLCRGHFGYIELPLPVVNPMYLKNILQVLKVSCLDCYTFQFPVHVRYCVQLQMKLLKCGLATEALEVGEKMSEAVHAMSKDENGKRKIVDIASMEDLLKKFRRYYEKLANRTFVNLNNRPPTSRNKETVRNEILYDLFHNFSARRNCMNCKKPIKKISVERNKVIIRKFASGDDEKNEENGEDEDEDTNKPRRVLSRVRAYQEEYLTPDESRKYMRAIWEKDGDMLRCLLPVLDTVTTEEGESPVDCLYYDVVPVLPPMCRPASFVDDRMSDHPQTQAYKAVMQSAILLGIMIKVVKNKQIKNGGVFSELPADTKNLCEVMQGKTPAEKLNFAWENLQYSVNALIDKPPHYRSDGLGLKQIIEKKQGIVRMNMMGKRVNYSARSVITPDPYLRVDEVGIPEAFAKTLTYPTPVTHWNVEELRKVVVNGPNVYPGANLIELEDGTIKRINPADPIQREGIAKTLLTPCIKGTKGVKKVYRHMRNGDVVLLNRQPTLHRPSLMAHKVRILGGEKVLRLHYANCKAYNADFDGDEMNVHFPQNEVARCEALQLANVASHYVVPKDGTPLSGLIQDHVISGVSLSMRGRFFTKPEYDNLVYQGLSFKISSIKVLPPTILKPLKLWSGKQVLSTIILNLIPEGKAGIRLTSTSKIGAKEWEVEKPRQWLGGGTPFKDAHCMSETEVVIRNGELLVGVLDKAHYGSTPYGLVHCFYELYGGLAAVKLLSAFSRLFTAFMSGRKGFTLSVEDILVSKKADAKRRKTIEKLRKKGAEACVKALDMPPDTPCEELAAAVRRDGAVDPQQRNLIDREYKLLVNPYTQKITQICMSSGLIAKFPKNNLQLMIQSGAKGGSVNAIQISCLLGQIELEGKRPPLMISGKSLPNFPVNDLSPRAGGFIDQRFMTGISPPEFFFHCMAGREGLIDTAVKTSRSGYLQRCLVKHLEGLHVSYDMTVRDSDGSVVQFLYGEDGMDTSKVQFLNKKQLPFLEENADIVVDKNVLDDFKNDDDKRAKKVQKHQKKISSWREKFGDPFAKNYGSGFGKLAGEVKKRFQGKLKPEVYREAWAQVDDHIKDKLMADCQKCPDPITSLYRPDHHFGSLSENQADLLQAYCQNKPKKQRRTVENMYKLKSSQSLCAAGEPVGLLAAQSIGEPSTQMTLNTFHFAGRGEMNVTLGIPRLREILMMASKNIKTPSMEIPFNQGVPDVEAEAERLKKTLTRVLLSDVLHKVDVEIVQETTPVRQNKYTLGFHFLPHSTYEDRFKVRPKAIIKHVTKKFFGEMFTAIRKFAKGQKVNGIMIEEAKRNSRSNRKQDDEDDEEDGDDSLATSSNNKSTSKNNTAVSSDDDASDEEPEDVEDARSTNKYAERINEQEPDDEEETEMAAQDGDASDLEMAEDGEEGGGEEGDRQNKDDSKRNNTNGKKTKKNSLQEGEDKNEEENTVLNTYSYIQDYSYDKKGYLWCTVVFALPIGIPRLTLTGMLASAARSSVVWEVPKIKKAITYTKDDRLMLRTDGVNILEMCKYSRLLDLNKLHCNDIYHVSQTYGIEAARRVIVKEVQDVFAVYGIEVDPRHLLLVADYMCFNGTYEPLSRKCMEGGASPFQQMSFESHLTFLKSAVVGGKRDDLYNPSSGLIAGKPVEIGSNLCDIMIDLEMIVRQNNRKC